jgi:transposase
MEINYPILGIDVSKATLDLCLLTGPDQRTPLRVANTATGYKRLWQWLQKQTTAPVTACLEATNVYSAGIALFLYQQGATVCLANPAAVHSYMGAELRRAKTDKADAISIAEFAGAMARKLRPWQPLPADYETLRDLVRHLHTLTRNRASIKNQLEKTHYLSSAAKQHILRSHKADLAHYDKQIRAVKKEIQATLKTSVPMTQRFERLTTPPGIGEITALTYMAEIPDVRQFPKGKHLTSFAGITPRIRHSGKRKPESQPISKMGSGRLRQALYMASLSAKQYNPSIALFAQRLQNEGKKPKVVNIAVGRKLLLQLYAIDKNHTTYDPNYHILHLASGTN